MKAIRRFTVRTVLPPELSSLEALIANLRWSWHTPTRRLFKSIDPLLWAEAGQDPIAFLGAVSPERLRELAADTAFVARAEGLLKDLQTYLTEPRWYQTLQHAPASIGYFSPEFGIAAALPQYSGGLGILAGDHLKAASDLGLPLIGVGLFYAAGYFRQSVSRDGWQQESYPVLDPDGMPLTLLRDADGSAVRIVLALPDDAVLRARVWVADVGRVKLLLLDTNVPENDEGLRGVTDRLYGGGGEHRLLQELLLGVGGVRALKAYCALTGTAFPEVFHTNEGHAGFLGLERIADLIGDGLTFQAALQVTRAATVFTTHTPVPAGIDRFEASLVRRYCSTGLLPGVAVEDVLALGAEDYDGGDAATFNMAVMGLRLAQRANGVSKLHGEVSRRMFGALWPGFDAEDVPITSITNGVHAGTWTDPLIVDLARAAFGSTDTSTADWRSPALTDEALWRVRGELRAELVGDARARLRQQWFEQYGATPTPDWVDGVLDPEILTIGFARRVPTYKRLTLMLTDKERLRAILTHPERPVQIVVAGKSHPADDAGKRLIQELLEFAADPDVRRRIAFLPNYDIGMARQLNPGTDVWLNNPLRPFEACGTSGMKAAINGSLNLSILDGWWAESYDGENGWAIPSADSAGDAAERDALEAASMYDLIEHQIAPAFYERDESDVPRRWVRTIRHSLAGLSGVLSAERMVREYVERLYAPAAAAFREITADDAQPASALADWRSRVVAAWPDVAVLHVESGGVDAVPTVGETLGVRARVALGGLKPAEVKVEVVYGRAGDGDRITDVVRQVLALESVSDGVGVYGGTIALERPGPFGYTVRVTPHHARLATPAELGLIAVAN
ncbi:MAG TPA: alpha-glucan family phosphorylase [Microbacteriaceae bacterium]|nr:alpha-glucan family phosphorylase [Microbacteriaceae bacterium]